MDNSSETRTRRARPMAIEQRREMIATAAIPLFIECGASLTTRQIADHLGIAEGTIFRAFKDKEALARTVVHTFMQQAHGGLAPVLLDPELDLEEKLHAVVRQARSRAKGMFAILSLLDPSEVREYMKEPRECGFEEIATAALATDSTHLNLPPAKLGTVLRLLAVAASAPQLSGGKALSDDELVHFALYGIIGYPARGNSITEDGDN